MFISLKQMFSFWKLPQIADVEWLQQAQCCLMRWFNGKRSLAHTSLGKTKVNTSFLLSCECATPAEGFVIHQLETAQCWFHHGGIKPKEKKSKQRKLSRPHKTSEIKEVILQSWNENQRSLFYCCTFNNSGSWASMALKRWQIHYHNTVLRQIKQVLPRFGPQAVVRGKYKSKCHKDEKRRKNHRLFPLPSLGFLPSPSSLRSAAICWKKSTCRVSCGGTS